MVFSAGILPLVLTLGFPLPSVPQEAASCNASNPGVRYKTTQPPTANEVAIQRQE
jgi:hypothetical protein